MHGGTGRISAAELYALGSPEYLQHVGGNASHSYWPGLKHNSSNRTYAVCIHHSVLIIWDMICIFTLTDKGQTIQRLEFNRQLQGDCKVKDRQIFQIISLSCQSSFQRNFRLTRWAGASAESDEIVIFFRCFQQHQKRLAKVFNSGDN